jgi:HSP20 family protein
LSFLEEGDNWSQGLSDPTGLSVSEDEKNIYVEAALPGLSPEDIEMTLDKDTLCIQGEKKEEIEDKKRKFYQKASKRFAYRVSIPGNTNPNLEPNAKYENGILKVAFTKSQPSQPKKITIKK